MANRTRHVTTVTGNGTSGEVFTPNTRPWTIRMAGTWDGATVTIELGDKDGADAYVWGGVVDNGAFTSDNAVVSDADSEKVRFVTTGAGASTDIDISISR